VSETLSTSRALRPRLSTGARTWKSLSLNRPGRRPRTSCGDDVLAQLFVAKSLARRSSDTRQTGLCGAGAAPWKRSSISTVRCLFGKTWKRASVCTRAKRGSVMTFPRPRPRPPPACRPAILHTTTARPAPQPPCIYAINALCDRIVQPSKHSCFLLCQTWRARGGSRLLPKLERQYIYLCQRYRS